MIARRDGHRHTCLTDRLYHDLPRDDKNIVPEESMYTSSGGEDSDKDIKMVIVNLEPTVGATTPTVNNLEAVSATASTANEAVSIQSVDFLQ